MIAKIWYSIHPEERKEEIGAGALLLSLLHQSVLILSVYQSVLILTLILTFTRWRRLGFRLPWWFRR